MRRCRTRLDKLGVSATSSSVHPSIASTPVLLCPPPPNSSISCHCALLLLPTAAAPLCTSDVVLSLHTRPPHYLSISSPAHPPCTSLALPAHFSSYPHPHTTISRGSSCPGPQHHQISPNDYLNTPPPLCSLTNYPYSSFLSTTNIQHSTSPALVLALYCTVLHSHLIHTINHGTTL